MSNSSSTPINAQKLQGFVTLLPKPEPIRHTRTVTLAEVTAALKEYMTSRGIEVPQGKMSLSGACAHGNLLWEITQDVELSLVPLSK